jgi:hypothetical protein
MYLQNKYTSCYFNIINRAKSRSILGSYTEKHHIIPKSLGGNNSKDNLVKLTAKEHYICHLLLPKMTIGVAKRSMWHALWKIVNQKRPMQDRYKISSRQYEVIKIANSIALRERNLGKIGPNKGKKFSEETKQKMSLSAKGRKPSPQAVEALINSRKGKPPSNKGKPMSQEQKDKISASRLKRFASLKNRIVNSKG